MSQDHKVLLTVILAHVTGIFLKRDVEDRVSDQFQPESRLRTAAPKARASSGKLMRE